MVTAAAPAGLVGTADLTTCSVRLPQHCPGPPDLPALRAPSGSHSCPFNTGLLYSTMSFFFLSKNVFIYLKVRVTKRNRKIFHPLVFSSNGCEAGQVQSQELHWVSHAGARGLGPPLWPLRAAVLQLPVTRGQPGLTTRSHAYTRAPALCSLLWSACCLLVGQGPCPKCLCPLLVELPRLAGARGGGRR